jgi:ABC-type transport system involved in multi-copper enzyme maturation permease subunit
MWPFFLASWRSGLRSRGAFAILVFGLLFVGVALVSASFSPRQPQTVVLDVGYSGIRFSLVFFGLFWVQELIAREIQQKSVLYSLAYPVPRVAYLVGRFAGVVALLALATLMLGIMLRVAVSLGGSTYAQSFPVILGWPYWIVLGGLWIDAVVVAAFALLIASLSTVNLLSLALGIAFAVSGKGLGVVVDYLKRGADGDVGLLNAYAPIIEVIQWVLPDLSRLDWRVWPMYGRSLEPGDLGAAALLAAGYATAMIALATLSFRRREFS